MLSVDGHFCNETEDSGQCTLATLLGLHEGFGLFTRVIGIAPDSNTRAICGIITSLENKTTMTDNHSKARVQAHQTLCVLILKH